MSCLDATRHADRTAPARPALHESTSLPRVLRSPKILDRHLDRLAIVYVRQSDPQQVLNHRESRERQYALADHAAAWGWPRDRVLVIDDDQGLSGRTADQRGGFQRLLAEVTMEHVGLILGIEMSRIARNNKDWHNLLEMCAIFGTLLADEDGVYDPQDTNDRLLLGLKGTISEFELVTMRNRLERGRLHKAQRGELFHRVPTGYVKLSPDRVEMDPDEQVREVIRLIFDKYDEIGTAWGVFHYLIRNNIRLGFRPFHGPNRGNLEWRRPVLLTVLQILRHPIYAGAYAYGRRPHKRVRTATGERTSAGNWVPMEQWKVLKRDCLPAYITWDRYLANQESLRQHRSGPGSKGSPRDGSALLTGLIVCGNCGRCLQTSYRAQARAYYSCVRHLHEGTEQACFGLKAAPVDDLVTQQVLRALEPAALELSCRALEDVQRDRARLDKHWKQRLERARYEAEDAERRYRAVDPENRLVARSLEQRWEETLRAERAGPRRLRPIPPRTAASALTGGAGADRGTLLRPPRALARPRHDPPGSQGDHPAPGGEGRGSREERQRICGRHDSLARRLHQPARGRASGQVLRAAPRLRQAHGPDRGLAARRLHCGADRRLPEPGGIHPAEAAAARSTPNSSANCWCVAAWRTRRRTSTNSGRTSGGCRSWPKRSRSSAGKLADWARRGWLHSRRTPAQRLWVLWADKQEVKRLRKLAALSHRGVVEYPPELTTPKKRR